MGQHLAQVSSHIQTYAPLPHMKVDAFDHTLAGSRHTYSTRNERNGCDDRDDCDARALGLLRSIYKLDYRSFNIKDWDIDFLGHGRFAIGIEVLELTIERAPKPQDWEQDTQTWALREGHGGWRSEKRTGSSYARVSDPLVPAVITFKWREPRVYL